MAKRILICGLPGSGKTTFARELASRLDAQHVNGDAVREAANNWDFTLEGRMEQALRMRAVADTCTGLVVSDFVAPTPEIRAAFNADLTVFMNTRAESQYPDTNAIFVPPENADYVTERWVENEEMDHVAEAIRFMIPQGLMIGRFQPWHAGHEALFDKILEKEGYVGIGVRFMPNGPDNPGRHGGHASDRGSASEPPRHLPRVPDAQRLRRVLRPRCRLQRRADSPHRRNRVDQRDRNP